MKNLLVASALLSSVFAATTAGAVPVGEWVKGPADGAVVGGKVFEDRGYGRGEFVDIPICRVRIKGYELHTGKLWAGQCLYELGGEGKSTAPTGGTFGVGQASFEVLIAPASAYRWVPAEEFVRSLSSYRPVDAGYANNSAMPACRGNYSNGQHPGKWWAGSCLIEWGEKAAHANEPEILVAAPPMVVPRLDLPIRR